MNNTLTPIGRLQKTPPVSLARRGFRWTESWFLLGILAVACLLRIWNINAPFGSSDQAAMAHMSRYNSGVYWIMAHDYGPVAATIQAGWLRGWSLFELPSSEAAVRIPAVVISLLQVLLTYPLLRRLRCSREEALAGCAACAALPALVSSAHFPWLYNACWLLTATSALWLHLLYLDTRRFVYLLSAAAALFIHCLSNIGIFGLPIVLLIASGHRFQDPPEPEDRPTKKSGLFLWPPLLVYSLAGCAALAVMLFCWWWTGGGQIGRLLVKSDRGTLGPALSQILRIPSMLVMHFSYIAAVLATLGLLFAALRGWQRKRIGLLACWATAGLIPVVLLVDWNRVGYPGAYMYEVIYPAALCGAVLAVRIWRKGGWFGLATGAMAVAGWLLMILGSIDVTLPGDRLQAYTGTRAGWGDVRPDSGIKAAGWYVRHHVPPDAMIMTLHDNQDMEVLTAEYYLGRMVLADYDLSPAVLDELWSAMQNEVDVVIAPARYDRVVSGTPGFSPVCILQDDQGRMVRCIYARDERALPTLRASVRELNRQYDRTYCTRKIPARLEMATGFEPLLQRYQALVRRLRQPILLATIPPGGNQP